MRATDVAVRAVLPLAALALCLGPPGCRSPATENAPEAAANAVAEEPEDETLRLFAKLPPNDKPYFWEDLHRGTSFVTDRPDLSAPPSARRDDRANRIVSPYFTTVGLKRSDARDLLVALDGAALLMRFRLDRPQLKRFLQDKRKLKETPAYLLRVLYDPEADVWVQGPKEDECAHVGFDFLAQYPFVRLTWWPVSQEQVAGMVAYEAKLKWDRNESHVGATYYLFVNDKTGLVYLLGW